MPVQSYESIPSAVNPFEQLLVDVEALLGLTITVHDLAGIFVGQDGKPLLVDIRRSHRHPYCAVGRFQRMGWDRSCMEHCQHGMNRRLRDERAPVIHTCWKSAQEVVVPVMKDGMHLATLYAGVFRPARGETARLTKLPRKVVRMHEELPVLDSGQLESISRLLEAIGQGMLALLEEQRSLDAAATDRKTEVMRFIHYRAHRPTNLDDLARTLHLSASRTSHLVRELFDRSFQELLIEERIRRAQSLLVGTSLTVGSIAERVGLPNEYYFNRLFKKRVGVPPGTYRKRKRTVRFATREG